MKHSYHYYVIIPHFAGGEEPAHRIINTLPKEKLILLDKLIPDVTGNFGAVYENFQKDIYQALEQVLPQLRKYQMLKIIFPAHSYYPEEIITGFTMFCQQYAINWKV